MNPLVFDIETKRDQVFLDAHGIEDMLRSQVKLGNTKDLSKVAEKQEEGLLKKLEAAAKDPLTGRVVAIGVSNLFSDDSPVVFAEDTGDSIEDERAVIQQFADYVRNSTAKLGRPVLCGYNIRGFDIPFLLTRAAIRQVEMPPVFPHMRDYRRVVDAMDVLSPDPSKRIPLNTWLARFGLPLKTDTGANVENMSITQVQEYCRADVERERSLIRRCRFMFPALIEEESAA